MRKLLILLILLILVTPAYSQYALTIGTLGRLITANFNTTADQAIAIHCSGYYVVDKVIVANPSTSLTLAVGGIYTGAGKTGSILVAAATVYTALTGASKYLSTALTALVGTDKFTANPVYLALSTAQGGAATADVFIQGSCLQ